MQKGTRDFRLGGEYDEIIEWNIRLVEISEKRNYPEGEVQAYINIASALRIIGKYDKSIDFLNIAKSKVKKLRNPLLKGKVHSEYAQIYNGMGLYGLALKNNSTALTYAKKIASSPQKRNYLAYIYGCRSVYLRNINLPDSSLVYLHKSAKLRFKPINLSNLANHYLRQMEKRDLDSAFYYLKSACSIVENGKATIYEKAVVNRTLGSYYFEKKDYQTAITYYNKVLELTKDLKVSTTRTNTYESLIRVYDILEDRQMELLYRQKHKVFTDSIDRLKNKAINASLDLLMEQKERENISSHKRLYGLASLITSVLIAVLGILFYRNRKKHRLIIKRERENLWLKKKMDKAFDEVVELAKRNDPAFAGKFQEVYPEFSEGLLKMKPALTPSEFVLCAYIWLNFSSKEIATYTFVTHKTVQVKKYRLRKKLGIPTNVDLYHFFKTFNEES
ncbi:tetratricopeptide repeat protein [Sinomicrobium sp.]